MELLKIIQHNVQHWATRKHSLTNIYMDLDPDIMLLNSTGIKNREIIKIFNYNTYLKNKYDEINSGVAIAIKKNIKHRIIEDFQEDFLAVEVQTRRGPIVIATTYLPPRRNFLPNQDFMKLMRKQIPTYLAGDLNAYHRTLGHSRNNNVGTSLARLLNLNIIQYLGPDFHTTLGSRGIGMPDIVLANRQAHLNYHLKQGPLTTSDHLPIIVTLATKPIMIPSQPKLNFKKANWDRFSKQIKEELEETNIRTVETATQREIEELLDKWYRSIARATTQSIPTKTFKILPHPLTSERIKHLQYNLLRIKTSLNIQRWTQQLHNDYKEMQRELQEAYTTAYNENWKKLINNIEANYKDPPKFWKDIKRLMGTTETHNSIMINQAGQEVSTDREKEAIHREHLINIFQISDEENAQYDDETDRMVNEFLITNRHRFKPYQMANKRRLNGQCELTKPIIMEDMEKIINSFKNKAPGQSGINKTLLKKAPKEAIEYLSNVNNLALSMGYFPAKYKQGLVILIPKPGKSPKHPANYRPITLLEVPGKIFEKIITTRFNNYLETNGKLNDNQYGFRRGRGTQVALAKLYETIAINQHHGHQCNVVCRDVAKAFDKIWHAGLKYKIAQLLLPDIFEKLLCNFLDDRYIKIKMPTMIGEPFQTKSGVPQGSNLSPLLYIYYTSDIPNPTPDECVDIGFADDFTQVIQFQHRSRKMLATRTVNNIKRINNFEYKWKIKTNKTKFQLLTISKSKPEKIELDGEEIPFRKNVQILGLKLSRTGTSCHMKQRIALGKSQSTKLKRFGGLSPRIKVNLYKTLIRSVIEYPAIPICITSRHNKLIWQRHQNVTLRNAERERLWEDDPPSIQELHQEHHLEAVNVRLFRLANNTWGKLQVLDPELIQESNILNNLQGKDHTWWPRIGKYLRTPEPEPKYLADDYYPR